MSEINEEIDNVGGTDNVEALSIAQIRAEVRDEIRKTMVEQTADLIQVTNRNTLKMIEEDRRRAAPYLLDTISSELKEARKKETNNWKTDINKSNFDALKDAETIYNRAQRLVEATEVTDDTKLLKEGAIKLMEEGKEILEKRLQLIRYADKEGWLAALHYEGDDIAENEAEAKKMRKSKKDTEAEKEKEREKRAATRRATRGRSGQGYGQGSSTYRRSDSQGYRDRSPETRTCYRCRRKGHIASNCRY